jgi:hypothetical protein
MLPKRRFQMGWAHKRRVQHLEGSCERDSRRTATGLPPTSKRKHFGRTVRCPSPKYLRLGSVKMSRSLDAQFGYEGYLSPACARAAWHRRSMWLEKPSACFSARSVSKLREQCRNRIAVGEEPWVSGVERAKLADARFVLAVEELGRDIGPRIDHEAREQAV